MRIGILNFHRSYNYGAFLQCYSLKERIKNSFPNCEVEVIDYIHASVKKGYDNSVNAYDDPKIKKEIQKRNQGFDSVLPMLNLSPETFIVDSSDEVLEYMNTRYDAVVVGSDAVWNWVSRGFPNIYFLKGYRGRKFSYAASAHLLPFEKVTDEQKKYLQDALSEFDYLGVRDIATENFLREIDPNLKFEHNCDPTMFLDVESIPVAEQEVLQKLYGYGIDIESPMIALMANPRNIGRELSSKFEKKSVVSVYEANKFGTFVGDLNPFEWMKVLSLCGTTITHYFHGTLLSLKGGTPVLAIETASQYNKTYVSKLKDVLGRLDLGEWYNTTDYNKIQRGLKKYDLYYDFKLWNKLFKQIDDFLINVDIHQDRIAKSLEKEAQSYLSFENSLRNIM